MVYYSGGEVHGITGYLRSVSLSGAFGWALPVLWRCCCGSLAGVCLCPMSVSLWWRLVTASVSLRPLVPVCSPCISFLVVVLSKLGVISPFKAG